MGDKVSIGFKTGEEESVVLFSHWGGREFADYAFRYARDLMKERSGSMKPLDRFEPNTVMVDFLNKMLKDEDIDRIESNYYFGKDSNEGDNSDNGHYVIEFFPKEGKVSMK